MKNKLKDDSLGYIGGQRTKPENKEKLRLSGC